jgi:hypothetical protein
MGEFQESGTPPSPSGPFPVSGYLWAPGGASVTLDYAEGAKLFGDSASARVQCTFAGFAIVG